MKEKELVEEFDSRSSAFVFVQPVLVVMFNNLATCLSLRGDVGIIKLNIFIIKYEKDLGY